MIGCLKGVLGAVAGIIVGGALSFGLWWCLFSGFDTSKAPAGQQDSYSMGLGFALIGLLLLGGGAGCVTGLILALSWIPRRREPPNSN